MAASIASTTVVGNTIVVSLTLDDGSANGFQYPLTPPDGRSAGQWQTDCGQASLDLYNAPALGNGGPSASVSDDTIAVSG
jgi:hypothetical protein